MAEEKITITDLRKTISKQMSLSEDKASRFLAALIPAIIEGLKRDKLVRISGLGTFKLVWVEPRKSVNIQTGEDILLDGYNKLTFIPESYIREQINEPYSGLEAVRVDEHGQPLDPQSTLPGTDMFNLLTQQANEIKDILADLGQETDETEEKADNLLPLTEPDKPAETKEANKTGKTGKTSKTSKTSDTTTTGDTTTTPQKPAKKDKPADKPKSKPAEKPAEKPVEKPIEQPVEPAKEPEEETSRPFRGWLVALVTVLVLLGMLVAGYFILVDKLEDWANSLNNPEDEELFIEPEEQTEMLEIEPLQPMDSDSLAMADSVMAEEPVTPPYQPTLLGIEEVRAGSRLAQIARRYYNDPEKWVIIYEANKDVIKDPNHLQAGTKLKIPMLTK